MTTHPELSRRGFLKVTGGATAGLTLGPRAVADPRRCGGGAAPAVLNAWVRSSPTTPSLSCSPSRRWVRAYTPRCR